MVRTSTAVATARFTPCVHTCACVRVCVCAYVYNSAAGKPFTGGFVFQVSRCHGVWVPSFGWLYFCHLSTTALPQCLGQPLAPKNAHNAQHPCCWCMQAALNERLPVLLHNIAVQVSTFYKKFVENRLSERPENIALLKLPFENDQGEGEGRIRAFDPYVMCLCACFRVCMSACISLRVRFPCFVYTSPDPFPGCAS